MSFSSCVNSLGCSTGCWLFVTWFWRSFSIIPSLLDLSKIDGEDTPSVVVPVKEVETIEPVEETEEFEDEVDEIEAPVYTDGDEE